MGDNRERHGQGVPIWAVVVSLVVCFLGMVPNLSAQAGPHDNLTTYEGSKTCLPCHADQVNEAFGSAHYQWRGATPQVPNLGIAGKFGGINDFCTYPNINWLFQMRNLAGQDVIVGCATCHAGMGAKPTLTKTQAQLENIDCLMCHADTYKRVPTPVGNEFRFIPDPTINLPAVLSSIHMPTTQGCLMRCHVNAGGGPGMKQGDIDPLQLNPPRTLDVHMSSQGAGLSCLDCHTANNHRIAGRGNDIRETDLSTRVDCTNCHGTQPHGSADINRHTARVHCSVCHIPRFARNLPTDVARDFTQPVADTAVQRYEPHRNLKTNVKPAYLWFNGLTFFYKFGDPITFNPSGTSFVLNRPLGNIRDANSKIHAFKYHQAKQAYDPVSLRLLPARSKIYWETGDYTRAFLQGAAWVGWTVNSLNFTTSQRYLSLYHEVAPKENALLCGSCHNGGTQLNFTNLGYAPRTTRNGVPLCSSCHSSERADFMEIHRIHRGEVDCSICHTF